ncbi:hypothetical protein CB1_000978003 [Camelus ferus]|nr:hypothetical protein CB1_000978003 [Camelus ferus]
MSPGGWEEMRHCPTTQSETGPPAALHPLVTCPGRVPAVLDIRGEACGRPSLLVAASLPGSPLSRGAQAVLTAPSGRLHTHPAGPALGPSEGLLTLCSHSASWRLSFTHCGPDLVCLLAAVASILSPAFEMMGLGNGRRSMKSPPLLLAALVACVIVLGFNYWIASSRSMDLQTRILELEGRVRRAAAERGAVEMKKNEFQGELEKQREQLDKIQSSHNFQMESVNKLYQDEKARPARVSP